MNIAIYSSSYLPSLGGIQFELSWLLKVMDTQFQQHGINRLLFVLPRYDSQEHLNFEHIEPIEIDWPTNVAMGSLQMATRLRSLARKHALDLVNPCAAIPDGLQCWAASRLTRLPYVVACHGQDVAMDERFDYGARRSALQAWLIRRTLRGARRVITISRDMANFAIDAGAVEQDVRIIPNGIEDPPGPTEEIKSTVARLRSEHDIQPGQTVCLTLSGMREIKGHEPMVRALRKAIDQSVDLRLFIGAHGATTPMLKQLVRELHLEDRVTFIGFVTGAEKFAWLSLADVYCNTAFFEPFGLVYLEAIQHDTAVMGTKFGGARDIFEHGRDAHLVDPNEIDTLTEGFIALAKPTYRDTLTSNARPLLDKYRIERVAGLYLDAFVEAVEG